MAGGFDVSESWFYAHAGATFGPLSVDEIKEHIARRALAESDLVWREGAAEKVAAATVFAFAPPPAVPDWLADVVAVEKKELPISPAVARETPEWLEDLRLWVALDQYKPGWELFNQAGKGPAEAP